MTMSKATQDVVMRAAATTAAMLSIAGSLYIIIRYWMGRSHGLKKYSVNATNELIHILAWFDLFISFGHGTSIYPARTYNSKLGEPVTGICKLQAYDIMFNDLTLVFWNFFIAYNLYRWVCFADDQLVLHRRIPYYLGVTLGMAFIISTIGLLDNAYGDAGLWCWVAIPKDKTKDILWKYGGLFGWLLIVMLCMVFFLIRVKQNVEERIRGVMSEEAKAAYLRVVRSQVYVIIGFLICWMPGLSHRTLALLLNKPYVYPLNVIQAITCPLQGLMHAIIFGHFHQWIVQKIQGVDNGSVAAPEGAAADFTALVDVEEREDKHFVASRVSVFLSTVDLKHGAFPTDLHTWIPAGSDIYALTLLNCTNVRLAEENIGQHLVKVNHPLGYRSITSLAGAIKRGEIHGAQVCQIVFVSKADLASGNLRYNTRDAHLWTQCKPSAQAVGISMRFFDTSIALISCNVMLQSDEMTSSRTSTRVSSTSSGDIARVSPVRPVTALQQAQALGLNVERCHHTFVAGKVQHGMAVLPHSLSMVKQAQRDLRSWMLETSVSNTSTSIGNYPGHGHITTTSTQTQLHMMCSMLDLEVDRLYTIM